MSESGEETISREDFELLQQVKKEMKDNLKGKQNLKFN
jgi:hypothetical protein